MKSKFDKYWGDPEKMNMLIFIANVLDPRDKLEYMEYSLNQIYGGVVGGSLYASVKACLYELFDEYTSSCKPASDSFFKLASQLISVSMILLRLKNQSLY